MTLIEQLYKTLTERKRPEDVAELIGSLLKGSLTVKQAVVLESVAQGSLIRNAFGYTSMLQTFTEAVGANTQITKAIEIFELNLVTGSDYNQADQIEKFISFVSPLINKSTGKNNFLTDRLNKSERKNKGIDISKRNYNKKWRLLKRIEKKLDKFLKETQKIEFQKISKHGIAHTISFQEFSSDVNTACFIAYYNARSNLRSVFTNTSQDRPFDELSEMLLNRCKKVKSGFFNFLAKPKFNQGSSTNWWAIAHLYTSQDVLSALSDEQKGALLGRWTTILQQTADYLSEIWEANDINRQTMVVQRGNDSTTWNNTAGAWNKARDNWIELIYSLGMEEILDEVSFGKVLRLMAADVVAWHYSSGGQLDPNTSVWSKLPLPWEVFQGKAACTRDLITRCCEEAGLDPEKSGWTAPKRHGVAAFRPTPELVHGVSVSNPFLATVLKQNNYFSGKTVKSGTPQQE